MWCVFMAVAVVTGVRGGIRLAISVIIVVTWVFTPVAVITGVNVVVLTWLYLLLLLSHVFFLL